MGGGSGLLINSNRRGGGGSDFGCDGWFCDVLNAAMTVLVILIFATAFLGCFRSCFKKTRREGRSKSRRASSSEVPGAPEAVAQLVSAPCHVSVESPPDYNESDNLPPTYSSLRLDQLP
ncbi:unnamed protein product [Caenorhabditis sp. 36 PRJEB53466]|nr:unnamed protein product [Caenorhabditis sp. 36 PRJEB53466]